jgi:hypothetical protein
MDIQEQVRGWKEKYTFVYKVALSGKDYYFRSLTREDYIDILAAQTEIEDPRKFDHDLEVCKRCMLSGLDDLTKKAGISTVIAEKIMSMSGFESAEIEEL